MDKAVINFKEGAHITKDNGETIKWREKEKLTSERENFNTPENGRLTNTMDGVSYIPIHLPIAPGNLTRGNLKTE